MARLYGGGQHVTRQEILTAVDAIPTERILEALDSVRPDQPDDETDEIDEPDEMPHAQEFRRQMHGMGMSSEQIEENLAQLRNVRLTPRGTAGPGQL